MRFVFDPLVFALGRLFVGGGAKDAGGTASLEDDDGPKPQPLKQIAWHKMVNKTTRIYRHIEISGWERQVGG